ANIINLKFNTGDVFMIFSVLSWSMYGVASKLTAEKYSGFAATFYSMAVSLFLSFFAVCGSLGELKNASAISLMAVLYLGAAASGGGYLIYNLAIKELGATCVATFTNSLTPIFVSILAYFFFGEKLTPLIAVSLALAILGLKLLFSQSLTSKK
ncbi:MAG: DMT family transporter, partial [Elusimicrobia bacterium]|nr:DMT family transporter [Elusimicrobiota bacterium]